MLRGPKEEASGPIGFEHTHTHTHTHHTHTRMYTHTHCVHVHTHTQHSRSDGPNARHIKRLVLSKQSLLSKVGT